MADHYHDRETVVVESEGTSTGVILGIVALIIVALALWWMLLGPGSNATTDEGGTEVPVPSLTVPSVEPAP